MPTIQGIQGNIQQAFHPAEAEAGAAGERSGKKLALAAGAAIAASAAVIGVGLKKAFDLGGVFDDVADTIRVGTGATGAALDGLNDVAKKVGSTIPVEFDKVGSTVADLNTRMGLTGDSLQTVASQFLQAGKILGQDVDINSATAAFTAFGVQGDQVSAAMDTLFRVSQATGVGMNELTSAAKAQAPALQELGFSFEDTVALVGSLDKAGLNATAVTASLGKGLVNLAKDGEQPQEAFQRITGEISDLVSQGQSAQAIDLAAGIFGTRGATQFVGAVQSGTLNMQDLLAATGATTDTILGLGEETADAAESWQLLKNKAMLALEPIGTAVFNLAGDGMGKLVEGFDRLNAKVQSDVLPTMGQLWSILADGSFTGGGLLAEDSPIVDFLFTIRDAVGGTFKTLIDTGKQVFDVIGPPLMEAFNTIWSAVKPLIPTFLQLFQAFNPIGLLFQSLLPILPQIAGVVGNLAKVLADGVARALKAVAPLFETIVGVINRLMPFVTRLVASLLPPFVALIDKLAPLLDAVLGALEPVVNALIDALIPAIDALMPTVERVFTFIADTITNVMTVFGGLIDVLTGIFTGDWEKVWTGVKEIFGGIWDQIKNIFGTLWDVMVEFFTNLGPRLWEIVTGLAGQLAAWGGQFLGWIWQGIQDLWNGTVWPWFQALPGLAWEGIKAAAGWLFDRGAEFLQWLWNGITTKAEEVWAWFTALPQTIWDALVGFVGAGGGWLIDRGSEFLDWMWTGIKNKFTDIKNWFFGLPASLWGFVSEKWEEFVGWGEGIVNRMVEGIKSAGPAIKQAILDLFDFNLFESDRQVDNLKDLAGGGSGWFGLFGGARGAVVPGTDPGRRDNGIMAVRSGEAIMVPEWTKAIGGAPAVHAMNRAAEQGRLAEMMWLPGFARGGVFGQSLQAVGASAAQRAAQTLLEAIKQGVTSGVLTPFGIGGGASNGQWGPANPSGLAANTAAARDFIMKRWGITNIGGWRASGSVPGSDHPMGKALDVMIANYLSPGGIAQGTSIADWFVQNPNTFGTKYVIWRDRINQGGVWRPYSHPGGNNDTLAHRDHVHISYLTGAGQFAGGSVPADDNPAKGGILARFFGALASRGGGTAATAPAGSGVDRWRSTVLQALGITGQPASYADTVLNQMRTESSGNPRAINLTDINARRGIPSKGLMQVIDPTFRAYALPGYNSDIYDPLSNIIASIRYVLSRYGSIPAGMRGRAYDQGGWLEPGTTGVNMLNKPEAVLTPAQSDAYVAHAQAIADGYGGRVMRVEFAGDGPLTEAMVSTARVTIDGALVDLGRDIYREKAQTR